MLKGAIIGFGKIAQSSHLVAWNSDSLKDKVKITAAVEPDTANRTKSREAYPDIKFYSNIDDMLNKEAIDFVDITSPPKYHFDILQKCIDKKLHIVCEKPFTLTVEEAYSIKEKLTKADIILVPCHQYKNSPIWKEFKKLATEVESKSKILLQFNVFRMQADPGLAGMSDYWRTSSIKNGGGILFDTGIHYLYLTRWILGEPTSIYSNLTTLTHADYKCEDTCIINIVTNKGTAEITLTWAADKRHNDARLICNQGSLFYESGRDLLKNFNGTEEKIPVPDASDKAHYASLYVSLFNDFTDAVNSGQKHPEWIEDAFQSINILNKCAIASDTGKIVI